MTKNDSVITTNNHIDELPSLRIGFSEHVGDLVVKQVELEAKGFTMEEAIKGLEFLASKHKQFSKENNQ